MSKVVYQNTIFELRIGLASSFSGMVLSAFWKRALRMFLLLPNKSVQFYIRHCVTERNGQIARAQASCAEGRQFDSPAESNQLPIKLILVAIYPGGSALIR